LSGIHDPKAASVPVMHSCQKQEINSHLVHPQYPSWWVSRPLLLPLRGAPLTCQLLCQLQQQEQQQLLGHPCSTCHHHRVGLLLPAPK